MKRRRKNGLPAADRVNVKPIRRGKNRLRRAVALKVVTIIHWDLVVDEGKAVVLTALDQARELGKVWFNLAPNGDAGLVDWCEFVVSAAKDEKVINEIEWKLWFSNPKDDPRLLEFRRGFLEAKKLGAKG
jgi:hypothetical protein